MYAIAGIVGWFALGLIGAGWIFSFMQWSFPTIASIGIRKDIALSALLIFFGPATFIAGVLFSGFGKYGYWRRYQ